MIKCFNCRYQKQISKGSITPGGNQEYIVSCKNENICFSISFDASISDLPCWTDYKENIKKLIVYRNFYMWRY